MFVYVPLPDASVWRTVGPKSTAQIEGVLSWNPSNEHEYIQVVMEFQEPGSTACTQSATGIKATNSFHSEFTTRH